MHALKRDIELKAVVSEPIYKAVKHRADVLGISNQSLIRLAIREFLLTHDAKVSRLEEMLVSPAMGPKRAG